MTGAAIIATGKLAASGEGPSRFDQVLDAAGFGIGEVTVSGHRFTADSDIFDTLDLPNVTTMAALQSGQVQARLRKLPWIETASITRVFPGRIAVAVTERTPFAAWKNGSTTVLVDATGRQLSAVRDTDWPNLPRIQGAGAPEAASALFQMIANVPEIGPRVQVATRITGRRWQLQLTNGVRLELPPEGEATALASLLANKSASSWLDTPNTGIDLRSPTRIAARFAVTESAPPTGVP
ncbi:MAG: cell division protein FtsQ/DivIB [Hyphomicrobiaceae bacterium]